jgi:uncharacterized protein
VSDQIETILSQAQTIAVVGLSTNPSKSAHSVPAHMQAAGYRVIGVHPSAEVLLGEPAYPRLGEIPVTVDLVNVFRPSAEAAEITRQAAAIGAKAVWLQQGIRSDEAREIAEAAGMAQTLKRKWMTSPSATTYSLPSCAQLAGLRAPASPPSAT